MIASMVMCASQAHGDPEELPRMALCLLHLRMALERSVDAAVRQRLLRREAVWVERIAEDMQRYAVKHDGLRRGLASEEERSASDRALQILAGHRNVNALASEGDDV